jgi:hypothetical protein
LLPPTRRLNIKSYSWLDLWMYFMIIKSYSWLDLWMYFMNIKSYSWLDMWMYFMNIKSYSLLDMWMYCIHDTSSQPWRINIRCFGNGHILHDKVSTHLNYTYTTVYITELVHIYYSLHYIAIIHILQSTLPSCYTYTTVYITQLVHTAERQRGTYPL